MELRGLFPDACSQTNSFLTHDTHANGNRNSINTISTFNNVGSDNCGSIPGTQNTMRTSRGLYGRLPPLGKSNTSSGLNSSNDSKHREPSESKLSTLFDQYKVRSIG